MEIKYIVKYVLIITVILTAVFFSQQAYSGALGKNVLSVTSDKIGEYTAKGSNWLASIVYPKISGEVEKRGDTITNELNEGKEKISESVGEKIKNYFSNVANSILGKENNNSCPGPAGTPPTQTSPKSVQ